MVTLKVLTKGARSEDVFPGGQPVAVAAALVMGVLVLVPGVADMGVLVLVVGEAGMGVGRRDWWRRGGSQGMRIGR